MRHLAAIQEIVRCIGAISANMLLAQAYVKYQALLFRRGGMAARVA